MLRWRHYWRISQCRVWGTKYYIYPQGNQGQTTVSSYRIDLDTETRHPLSHHLLLRWPHPPCSLCGDGQLWRSLHPAYSQRGILGISWVGMSCTAMWLPSWSCLCMSRAKEPGVPLPVQEREWAQQSTRCTS